MLAAVALIAQAEARAEVPRAYTGLAERHLSPAPLVFTRLGRPFGSVDDRVQPVTTRRGYGLRIAGARAQVELAGGEHRTLKGLARTYRRRLGFKSRRTRVRRHRGWVLTRDISFGAPGQTVERVLAWAERGRVYTIGTDTARAVKAGRLRSLAAGLERLGGFYVTDGTSGDLGSVLVTQRTVSGTVIWDADCPTSTRSGSATFSFLRRSGSTFSFAIAEHRDEPGEPWTGAVTGTLRRDAVTVSLRARGTIDGEACDSGPVSLSIPRS